MEASSYRSTATATISVAVVLIDFQNECAKQGGRLYDDVSEIMHNNNMLVNVQRVVAAAR